MKWVMLVALVGCSTSAPAVPGARFANAPPATTVDDRRDVPTVPETRRWFRVLYNFDGQVYFPIDRALALDDPRRALGTTSVDEVADSTWFTNRIGVRPISPDELRGSPNGVGNPERYTPWTIRSSKVGGVSVGFIVTDTRGKKFLIKFDMRGFPEAETAAQVISGKLLWAAGYNTTDDYIAYVHRKDLVLAPNAVIEDSFGNKRRLDLKTLERKLALVDFGADGRIRTLASAFLEGKPLGGHPAEGTRSDDPNDRIPHERRRDLRGAYTIFAWLDHMDIQQTQMLDMWIADRADPNRHYVKHYFVDYGNSLGVMPLVTHNKRRGYQYLIDGPDVVRSLFTLGMWPRHWNERTDPGIKGVGVYETATFRPGAWRPTTPSYLPFIVADANDRFWGAKIVMKFTREHLRAAVEAGRLSDPRAVDYLVQALAARQRATGAYWFARVNPLDNFSTTPHGLCFDDLAVVYGFAPANTTTYALARHDRSGRAVGQPFAVAATADGRTCAPVDLAAGPDGYTIVRVSTSRPGFSGTTYVHLAQAPETRTPRVIGVYRP